MLTGLLYAVSRELYTEELQKQAPVLGRIVLIMAVAIVAMILSIVFEDICRCIFATFSLKSQSLIREGLFTRNIINANPFATSNKIGQELQSMGITELSFLDKDVSVDGSYLSGGQKQRVSNARAFLKGAQLYIMDEPTAALGKETEKMVL